MYVPLSLSVDVVISIPVLLEAVIHEGTAPVTYSTAETVVVPQIEF